LIFFRLLCTLQVHPSGQFLPTPGLDEVLGMAGVLLRKTRTVSNEQSANVFSDSLTALVSDILVNLACTTSLKQKASDNDDDDGKEPEQRRRKLTSWWDKVSVVEVLADGGGAALARSHHGNDGEDDDLAPNLQWSRVQVVADVVSRYSVHVPASVLERCFQELVQLAGEASLGQQSLFILVLQAISSVARAVTQASGLIRASAGALQQLLLAKLPTSPPPVQDAMCGALGCMVCSQLCFLDHWWRLVVQHQQKCRPALLSLVANCLQHLPVMDPEARIDLLRFVLDGYEPLLDQPNLTVWIVLELVAQNKDGKPPVLSQGQGPESVTTKALAEIACVRILPQAASRPAKSAGGAAVHGPSGIVPMQVRIKLEETLVNLLEQKSDSVEAAGSAISGKRRRTLGVDTALMSEKLMIACRLLKFFMMLNATLGRSELIGDVLQTVFANQLEFVAKYWEELAARPKKQAEILSELFDVVSSPLCAFQPQALVVLVETISSFLSRKFFRSGTNHFNNTSSGSSNSTTPAAMMLGSEVDEFGFGRSSSTSDDVLEATLAAFRLLGHVRCHHHGHTSKTIDPLLKRAFCESSSDLIRITLVSSVIVPLPATIQPPPSPFVMEAMRAVGIVAGQLHDDRATSAAAFGRVSAGFDAVGGLGVSKSCRAAG
jgi:hypothetical protein